MAGIADMIVGSALESAQKAPDISGSITKGAELAQTIQNMQVQREQMEKQKQELQMQKAVAVTDTLKIAASSKDPKLKNFLLKNVMPGKIKALGMEEFFPPQTMEMIQTSDAVQQKILGLQLDLDEKVRSGQMTGAQAYAEAQRILADPEELAMLDTDQLFEAQKFKNSEEGKSARAAFIAQSSLGKQIQGQEAAPTVEYKKELSKEAAKYNAGGKTKFENSIKKFDDVLSKLDSGDVKTGGWTTLVPGLNSEAAQYAINEAKENAKNDVQGIYEESLKETMGAQFTEGEGKRRLNRIWNDKASSKENARRLRADIEKLKGEMRAKEQAFRNAGLSVEGASVPDTEAWKKKAQSKKAAFNKLTPGDKVRFLEGLQKILNVPLEDIKKELGVK